MFYSTPDTSMLMSSNQSYETVGRGRIQSSKNKLTSKNDQIDYLGEYENDEDEDCEENFQVEVDLDVEDSPLIDRKSSPGKLDVNDVRSRLSDQKPQIPVSSDVFTDKDEDSFNDDNFFLSK